MVSVEELVSRTSETSEKPAYARGAVHRDVLVLVLKVYQGTVQPRSSMRKFLPALALTLACLVGLSMSLPLTSQLTGAQLISHLTGEPFELVDIDIGDKCLDDNGAILAMRYNPAPCNPRG